jgi:hypothetical protein
MKMNRKVLLFLGLALLAGLIWFIFFNKRDVKGSDFKIGILAEDGVSLVSISKERKMINVLKIDPEAKLWIPSGLGWYRNVVIKKVLQQEKKTNLLSDIIFYNFGYKPDKLLYLKTIDDWKNIYWWKLVYYNNYLIKDEWVRNDIDLSDDFLDEVMVRDYAQTKVIDEDLKLSIINTSNVNGLANFMTKRFERLGFSVISVGNDFDEKRNGCEVFYGRDTANSYSLSLIKKIINCDPKENNNLNGNEVEIYFDDKFSSMIEYPSYNK